MRISRNAPKRGLLYLSAAESRTGLPSFFNRSRLRGLTSVFILLPSTCFCNAVGLTVHVLSGLD
jgi:hypothetical protein